MRTTMQYSRLSSTGTIKQIRMVAEVISGTVTFFTILGPYEKKAAFATAMYGYTNDPWDLAHEDNDILCDYVMACCFEGLRNQIPEAITYMYEEEGQPYPSKEAILQDWEKRGVLNIKLALYGEPQ